MVEVEMVGGRRGACGGVPSSRSQEGEAGGLTGRYG